VFVEAQQDIYRLVLGRGSCVSVHGQGSQERVDFRSGGEEIIARPHTMESGRPYDPFTEERPVCTESWC
jgi:hypothetical protein